MHTFFIINDAKIDIKRVRHTLPETRWVQYYNCEEGLGALSIFHHRIKGVFVSYSMSFLNGFAIQKIIKKQFPYMPVIITYSSLAIDNFFSQSNSYHYLASYRDTLALKPFFNHIHQKKC